MEIYCEAFPQNERHAVSVIRNRIEQGSGKLHVGVSSGEVVFMALLWPLKGTGFILLDYMAAKNTHRSEGIGSMFIGELSGILRAGGKRLIAEVEDPACGNNRAEKTRRVSFYKRNGMRELKNVRYLLPPLQGGAPTEMILMVFPGYAEGFVNGEAIREAITQIYRELYRRDSANPLLKSFIGAVKGRIDLV